MYRLAVLLVVIVSSARAFPDPKVRNLHAEHEGFIRGGNTRIDFFSRIIEDLITAVLLTKFDRVFLLLEGADLGVGLVPGLTNAEISGSGGAFLLFLGGLEGNIIRDRGNEQAAFQLHRRRFRRR